MSFGKFCIAKVRKVISASTSNTNRENSPVLVQVDSKFRPVGLRPFAEPDKDTITLLADSLSS